MSTLVCFHAHPDDEVTSTGGTIATLVERGHRVVVVTATDGCEGEVPDGRERSELAGIRSAELAHAATILGVSASIELGYRDSGMEGEPENEHPDCFAQADVEVAAARLTEILIAESADALTIYDDHGGYGHPDHVAIHRVGVRAAEMAGVDRVFEATMNRDRIVAMMSAAAEAGVDLGPSDERPDPDEMKSFGSPSEIITHHLDVGAAADLKRQAMAAHTSQVGPDSFFLSMPPELFAEAFGIECFISRCGGSGSDPAALFGST